MENAAALVMAIVLLTAVVSWINRRHDRLKDSAGPTPDERVEAAWEGFGFGDDPAAARAALDALLDEVDPAALRRKNSIVSLAVMAARTEHYDVLPALAEQARALDGGCGETAALAVLAEACAGDPQRAREMYVASQSAMAGCGSCGTQGPGRYLMQEVAIMVDAMDGAAPSAALH
jgi:predicted DNA-binding transcriptional regulator YafY